RRDVPVVSGFSRTVIAYAWAGGGARGRSAESEARAVRNGPHAASVEIGRRASPQARSPTNALVCSRPVDSPAPEALVGLSSRAAAPRPAPVGKARAARS